MDRLTADHGTDNVPTIPAKLVLGAAAELLVASKLALLGYQVYRPLADDRGVDLLDDVGDGRHVAVQVKAVRHVTSSYIYMRKSTFALEPWTALALVVYGDSLDDQPLVYFVPAIAWRSPRSPLTSYDYVGRKSAPAAAVVASAVALASCSGGRPAAGGAIG